MQLHLWGEQHAADLFPGGSLSDNQPVTFESLCLVNPTNVSKRLCCSLPFFFLPPSAAVPFHLFSSTLTVHLIPSLHRLHACHINSLTENTRYLPINNTMIISADRKVSRAHIKQGDGCSHDDLGLRHSSFVVVSDRSTKRLGMSGPSP